MIKLKRLHIVKVGMEVAKYLGVSYLNFKIKDLNTITFYLLDLEDNNRYTINLTLKDMINNFNYVLC